jgi:manganese efflux pump family protein
MPDFRVGGYDGRVWYNTSMSWPDFLSILLLAIGLSADCFAVTLASSVHLKKLNSIKVLRTALSFGIAQAAMPAIGWAVGRAVIDFIAGFDHWVVFGLLIIIGGRMIWEALRKHPHSQEPEDISRGWLLVSLALATSIDALAVGLSFAFLKTNILTACLIIGLVAFGITILGFFLGHKAGRLLGETARIIGGVILIGIGVKVLVSHLLG